MAYCRPWQDNIIRILPLSRLDHEEVTIYHEWFHLYQYKKNKIFSYAKADPPASSLVPVGSYPWEANSKIEEEADAFALLLAKRSLDYDLQSADVRLWLSFMWHHLRREYPGLKLLLEAHYFTANDGFHSGDNDGDC